MAVVFALSMREMNLDVVIMYKLAVCFFDFIPTGCTIEIVIGETPHDPKVRLDVVLPGLARVDPLFTDVERLVNSHGAIRVENAASISHDGLWSAIVA